MQVIGLIVMAAANFCLGKEDDKIRWACYRELQENRTIIPQAAAKGSDLIKPLMILYGLSRSLERFISL